MNQKTVFTGTFIAALCLLSSHAPVRADDQDVTVTPYRPTLSNPVELSAPGWLELELGWQDVRNSVDKQRDSLPLTLKLAFSENWGMLLSTEEAVRRTGRDNVLYTGMGDSVLLLKHRLGGDPAQNGAWGVEAGFKLPTAKDTLGSGHSDYLVNLIYSIDGLGNRLDLNACATHIGAVGEGEGRVQYGWAASLSRGLDEHWGVFGELSGAYRRATSNYTQLLTGASYNLSKRMVLDAGVAHGLTDEDHNWTVFFGVSMLAARLW